MKKDWTLDMTVRKENTLLSSNSITDLVEPSFTHVFMDITFYHCVLLVKESTTNYKIGFVNTLSQDINSLNVQ